MRASVAGLLLAFAAAAGSPPAPPQAPPAFPFRTASFLSTITAAGRDPVSMRLWISPDGALEEIRKGGSVTHLLRTRGEVYLWVEQGGRGMRALDGRGRRSPGEPDAFDVLREMPEILKPGSIRRSRREKRDGVRLRRLDFAWTDPRLGAHEGTVWLLPDRDFPVRYEERVPGAGVGIVNSELRFDEEIPAVFFAPPRDVRFTDLLPHGGGMPPH